MAGRDRPDLPDDGEERRGERIIDVSTREPVVVEEEDDERAPFLTGGTERVRVFVASGGSRGCAIPLILVLLLLCCACIGFWTLADNIF